MRAGERIKYDLILTIPWPKPHQIPNLRRKTPEKTHFYETKTKKRLKKTSQKKKNETENSHTALNPRPAIDGGRHWRESQSRSLPALTIALKTSPSWRDGELLPLPLQRVKKEREGKKKPLIY